MREKKAGALLDGMPARAALDAMSRAEIGSMMATNSERFTFAACSQKVWVSDEPTAIDSTRKKFCSPEPLAIFSGGRSDTPREVRVIKHAGIPAPTTSMDTPRPLCGKDPAFSR